MAKRGRPPFEKYNIDTMCEKIEKYCEDTQSSVPILKECCLLNDWDYDYIMRLQRENPKLSQSIKKIHAKREIFYEKASIAGIVNPSWAIFVMKQPCHGWTDKLQIDTEKEVLEKLDSVLEKIKGD